VRLRIGRKGEVERVDLVESAGDRTLDEAALRAVRRAAPSPAEEITVTAPIVFDLEGGAEGRR
jgi:TonB family protein